MNSYQILVAFGVGTLVFLLLQFLKYCISITFGRNVAMSKRIIACAVMILFLTGFGIVTALALDA